MSSQQSSPPASEAEFISSPLVVWVGLYSTTYSVHSNTKVDATTVMGFNPLTPTVAIYGYTDIKHPVVPDRVKPSFVIFDIRALSPERQSARMSKITNDGLTRSGT